jgi:hypothetical protein
MVWNKENPRFEIIYDVDAFGVFVDNETGINYLLYSGVRGEAVTPLLNKDGKPVTTSIKRKRPRRNISPLRDYQI